MKANSTRLELVVVNLPPQPGILRWIRPQLLVSLCIAAQMHSVISGHCAPGEVDRSFDPGSGVMSAVMSCVVQSDSKVIIGGDFRTVRGLARDRIARLNADGTGDPNFDPGIGANDRVHSVALASDGRVLIAGSFTAVNGISRNRVARLKSDGTLDGTFNPGLGVDGEVFCVAVQLDGRVLIGGRFTSVNGVSRNCFARLNPDGSLDSSFNPGAGLNNFVSSVAVQSDGRVLIGGGFTTVNGVGRNYIARLNANGSLDTSFNSGAGPNNSVRLAVQSDGKVVIGGWFTTVNGTNRNRIARLNPDGTLDNSFDPGGGANNSVLSVLALPDGKTLIGGSFQTINNTNRNGIRDSMGMGLWMTASTPVLGQQTRFSA